MEQQRADNSTNGFSKMKIKLFITLLCIALNGVVMGQTPTPFGTWDNHIAITESGAGVWEVPAGVTEIQVEVIGAGGGGGARDGSGNGGWGGAGGGAYARSLLTVTPEVTLDYSVGAGGSGASGTAAAKTGGDTWFIDASTVMAKGGVGVSNSIETGGSGGLANASFGDVKFNGGRGANGQNNTTTTRRGGGGGGAAGPTGAGNYTSSITDRLAGTSGGAPGGDGGEAFDGNFANGRPGESYGGGGSGGCTSNNGNVNGGAGAGGLIIIAWNNPPCDAEITSITPAARCGSGTVSLAATATNGTPRWFDAAAGGTQLGTGSPFTTPTISETTTFWVEAYNSDDDCASARQAVIATINEAPVVTNQPTAQFACPDNGTATFSVTASGSGLTYQWQVDEGSGFSNITNGGVYSGATTATLTITDAPIAFNGYEFRCVVSGTCNPEATSNQVVLNVNSDFCGNEGDYRSVQTGSWGNVTTWERFDGNEWRAANNIDVLTEDFNTNPNWTNQNNTYVDNTTGGVGNSGHLSGTGNTSNNWYYTEVTLTAGRLYSLSFDRQTSTSTNSNHRVHISIGTTVPSGGDWGETLFNSTGANTSWTSFSNQGLFQAPSTGTYYFGIRLNNASGATTRIDNVELFETSGTPTSTSSATITIRDGHNITQGLNYTSGSSNDIIIENGGILTFGPSSGDFEFNSLVVENGGLFIRNTTNNHGSNVTIKDGAIYRHNINGGTIGTATWELGSTLELTGITSSSSLPGGLNQTFSRVVYNCPNQTSTWIYFRPTQVLRELVIQNTGTGRVLLYGDTEATPQLDISGDLIINGGRAVNDYSSGVKTRIARIGGNVIINGGILTIAEDNNSLSRTTLEVGKSFKLNGGTFRFCHTSSTTGEGYLDVKDSIILLDETLEGSLYGSSGFYAIGNGVNQHVQVDIPFADENEFRKRFFYKTSSGPSGLNEEYNTPSDNSMQFTIDGTGASPRTGHASWPTSGSLIKTITINNASNVTLSTNKSVSDFVELGAGKLITASCESSTNVGNILQMADNSTITGFDSDKYVVGILQKTGDDPFVFPVGSMDDYEPVSISAPGDASDKFGVCFMNQDPNISGYDRSELDIDLEKVAECHFWYVSRMVGSSEVQIGLRNDCIELANIVGAEKIARWDGDKWVNEGGAENNGIIFSDLINVFSPFTTSESMNTSLPVEITFFNSICMGSYVKLHWQTASELNNNFFSIYRSDDGVNWNLVDRVDGQGSTSQFTNYEWLDRGEPSSYIVYYKLEQTDFDGTTGELGIVSSDCKKKGIHVFPNPAKDYISVTGIEAGEVLVVLDAIGRVVIEQSDVSSFERIDIANLNKGKYFIKVFGANNVTIQTFIKID